MIKNIKKTFEVFYLTKLSLPRSPIIICFTVSRRRPVSASEFRSRVCKHFPLDLFTFTRRTSLSLALFPTTYLRTMAHWLLKEISWLWLHGNNYSKHGKQLSRGLSLGRKTSWCMEKSAKGGIKHGHLTNATEHF